MTCHQRTSKQLIFIAGDPLQQVPGAITHAASPFNLALVLHIVCCKCGLLSVFFKVFSETKMAFQFLPMLSQNAAELTLLPPSKYITPCFWTISVFR